MRRLIIIFLFIVMVCTAGYRKPYKYTIDAGKDAFYHNNVGLNYLADRIYYAAIQEFKIAIQLSPNTQATAIFKNNLGETYNYIGYPDMARICFEDSIKLYGLNLKYYINLADCYEKLGITKTKIAEYQNSEKIYDKIMLGMLYIKTGETRRGVVLLDEICQSNPELLITPAIRTYLKEVSSAL